MSGIGHSRRRALGPIAVALLAWCACSAEPLPPHADLSWGIDERGERRPIRTIDDWERRRADVLARMQTVMGTLPRSRPSSAPDVSVVLESVVQGVDGLVRRKISYRADSTGHPVRAWLFLPKRGGEERLPAVLCLHQTIDIGKDEPAGQGGSRELAYALELAKRGYVTLAPDYPSFGESGGVRPEGGLDTSGTMHAIVQNLRAIDVLASLDAVDPKRIGAMGHSLGGHNAMFTAAFDPRIRALVSSCGFTRFHRYRRGRLAGWSGEHYMPRIASHFGNDPDRVPFDFPEIVASFAPRAFLAIAPTRDRDLEVSGVEDSIAQARTIYRLYDAEENLQALHPDCGHEFPPEAMEAAVRFLDRHLRNARR